MTAHNAPGAAGPEERLIAEDVAAEALLDSNHHGSITEEGAEWMAGIVVRALRAAGLLNDGPEDGA